MITQELLCPFSEKAMSTYQSLFINPLDEQKGLNFSTKQINVPWNDLSSNKMKSCLQLKDKPSPLPPKNKT